jgi:hypothetical protein
MRDPLSHRLIAKIAVGLMALGYVGVAVWARRRGKPIRRALPRLAGPTMVFFLQCCEASGCECSKP